MDFNLPESALVNKFIAKSKFYSRTAISTKLQNEFINKIQKITWKYKLAEDTIGISKAENIIEIQIFEIELKQQTIPKNVLRIIDRTIPYPILYVFIYKDDYAYGICLKDNKSLQNYYFSEWNQEIPFNFSGINLEKIYQKLIKTLIAPEAKNKTIFNEAIALDTQIRNLEKEIKTLESKIKKERQFNRKVDLNKTLHVKKNRLNAIKKGVK